MPKFFVSPDQIEDQTIKIIGNDVNHIKNVLRKKIGEEIIVCDMKTTRDFLCQIVKLAETQILCNILTELKTQVESNIKISVFQGIPKADKMELIIQKSVELGMYDLNPVEMKRCVVKLNEKEKGKKISRWQKIAEVAAKQCGRSLIPEIKNCISWKNICQVINQYDIVLVAYEKEDRNTLKQEIKKLQTLKREELKIAIVIGPEGGIEESEIELLQKEGAKIITLGKRILRTETVAIQMISILMYELEN